jgi:NDP-sugar pyrophosphorylase family protein
MEVHGSTAVPWKVTLVDTGDETMTGGRLKRVLPYVGNEEFGFTYGDGVADADFGSLIEVHWRHGLLAAVQPPGRFGALEPGLLARARDLIGALRARRRRLDQRRLFRPTPRGGALHRGRRGRTGAGAYA